MSVCSLQIKVTGITFLVCINCFSSKTILQSGPKLTKFLSVVMILKLVKLCFLLAITCNRVHIQSRVKTPPKNKVAASFDCTKKASRLEN